jgi:16S rRNA (guanine966-N2)-methyltransferase
VSGLRVVAGELRGRRLRTPTGLDTRPTSDRVRESLFAILGDAVEGAAVLDLFAGSGALAIEALSRGASRAVLVERDRRAAAVIEANLEALGPLPAELVRADAIAYLSRHVGPFGIVFLDPPYSVAPKLAGRLSKALPAVLSPSSLIVAESDKRDPLDLALPLADERTYGNTRIAIHRVR